MDRITAQHLIEIEQKIADLKRLAKELRHLSTVVRAKELSRNAGLSKRCRRAAKPIAEMSHKGLVCKSHGTGNIAAAGFVEP